MAAQDTERESPMRSFFNWLQRSPTRRPIRRAAFRPALERLEERALLSMATVQVGTAAPFLHVWGQGTNDTIELRLHPDTGALQIRQTVDGQTHSEIVPLTINRIVIDGGTGLDKVQVKALRSDVTVEAKNVEQFNVGNGLLADVHGNMILRTTVGGPSTAVTFDDSHNTTDHHYFHVTRDGVFGATAFPQGTLDFANAQISALTIRGGSHGNAFDVDGTKGNTILNTGAGEDEVGVWHLDLTTPGSRLTLRGGGAGVDGDRLYVHDAGGSLASPAYVVSVNRFSRSGTGFEYNGFEYATFEMYSATGSVPVKSTAAGVNTRVTSRSPLVVGNDADQLDSIHGLLRVESASSVTLVDQGSTTAHSYTLNND